jgi:HSP20 family molecular chaperone IbpA
MRDRREERYSSATEGDAMAAMRLVGSGHRPPSHASVQETDSAYVVELDVEDFRVDELAVELLGPRLTVRGEQRALEDGSAFCLREQLEETFRLPDDVDLDALRASHAHGRLEIRAPKKPLLARAVPIETSRVMTANPDATPC